MFSLVCQDPTSQDWFLSRLKESRLGGSHICTVEVISNSKSNLVFLVFIPSTVEVPLCCNYVVASFLPLSCPFGVWPGVLSGGRLFITSDRRNIVTRNSTSYSDRVLWNQLRFNFCTCDVVKDYLKNVV